MTQPAEKVTTLKPLLTRHTTADSFNEVVNHPEVLPWMGPHSGTVDMSGVVENPSNILLMGEYGGFLFVCSMPGLYEIHAAVFKDGRGAWTQLAVAEALHWMFTRTPAVEITARIPQGNLAVLALARMCHAEFEFQRPNSWVQDGRAVTASIYSLSVQQWMRSAPGLVERGNWLSNRIKKAARKQGMSTLTYLHDELNDRYSGAAIEMIMNKQVAKGITLFNRWASMSGINPISVVSENPLTIDIRSGILIFRGSDFWVIPCLPQ